MVRVVVDGYILTRRLGLADAWAWIEILRSLFPASQILIV